MRSLAVLHLADSSGPSRSLEDGFRWLADQGELEVLIPGRGRLEDDLREVASLRSAPYEALTVPAGLAAWRSALFGFRSDVARFRRAIRELRPDLVLVSSAMLPAPLVAAWLESAPSMLYAGEILDAPRVASTRRAAAGRTLTRLGGYLARTVIACSERVAQQYVGRGRARVVTVHPPIDSRYEGGDAAGFRARHGLDPDTPLITAVGALTHGRGQDVLVRAMPAIRRRHPAMALVLVGEPHPRDVDRAYGDELRRLAAEVGGTVVFAGFDSRVEDAYAAAEVVVNPARYEAFGRVAFEALVAGTPVVSTHVGGIPDVLRDRLDAILVPPDDPDALAQAVCELLADGALAESLVAAGQAHVRAELTRESALAGFRSAVETTVGRAAG